MRARRGLLLAVVVTFMSLLGLTVPQAALRAATAAGPCDPPANPIVCENSKAGTPASTWDISGSGSSTIQGFTTDISADLGQTVTFKVKTPAKSYRLDIY
ncbi:MAG TPA: hypothetical protein VFC03_14030, partial [Acidimicrobiales bacterium]|nr:hypothetical protein [Acidimicrobiales bacterium]